MVDKRKVTKASGAPSARRSRAASDQLKPEFAALFTGQPTEVVAIGRYLRAIILDVMPDAVETVLPRARLVLYREPEGSTEVCGIQPNGDRCNFYLTHGTKLRDPLKLLEGRGRGIRHVKVRSLDDPPSSALEVFVRASRRIARA